MHGAYLLMIATVYINVNKTVIYPGKSSTFGIGKACLSVIKFSFQKSRHTLTFCFSFFS